MCLTLFFLKKLTRFCLKLIGMILSGRSCLLETLFCLQSSRSLCQYVLHINFCCASKVAYCHFLSCCCHIPLAEFYFRISDYLWWVASGSLVQSKGRETSEVPLTNKRYVSFPNIRDIFRYISMCLEHFLTSYVSMVLFFIGIS